jgi:hypothetical protein
MEAQFLGDLGGTSLIPERVQPGGRGAIPSGDCEEVARVILGADMNMRLSFKPKQSS